MTSELTGSGLWLDPELPADLEGRLQALLTAAAPDAAERDRSSGIPTTEAALLREARIAGTTIGGSPLNPNATPTTKTSQQWEWGLSLVRRLARVDAGVAALLGYSFLHTLRVGLSGNNALIERLYSAVSQGNVLLGGANNPRGVGALVSRDGDDYLFDGTKHYASGSATADWLVIAERVFHEGEEVRLAFLLENGAAGISHLDNWSSIGAIRSSSGSIAFERTRAAASDVIESRQQRSEVNPAADEIETLSNLGFQIFFVNLLTGFAQGAVDEGKRALLARAKGDPARVSEAALTLLGEQISAVSALAALTEQANQRFGVAVELVEQDALDDHRLRALGDLVSRSKIAADRVSLEVTTKIFELGGASLSSIELGLDRFWRNARTFTLHDPVSERAKKVGRIALSSPVE